MYHSRRVLIRRRFTDDFLDYQRGPSDYLVESVVWKNLERLQGLYYERPKKHYERPKSLWMIWNYLWDIGPRQTIRKVPTNSELDRVVRPPTKGLILCPVSHRSGDPW